MLEADKKQFALETRMLFELLNQPLPDKTVLKTWWDALIEHDINQVLTAFNAIADLKAIPTLEQVQSWLKKPQKPIEKPVNDNSHVVYNFKMLKDSKDWARKILNEPKGRELIAIKHAKFALGLDK